MTVGEFEGRGVMVLAGVLVWVDVDVGVTVRVGVSVEVGVIVAVVDGNGDAFLPHPNKLSRAVMHRIKRIAGLAGALGIVLQ